MDAGNQLGHYDGVQTGEVEHSEDGEKGMILEHILEVEPKESAGGVGPGGGVGGKRRTEPKYVT